MAVEIKEISSKEDWKNFESGYSPHSFLQSWEWGETQKILKNKIFRLGIFQDKKLEGVAFIYKLIAKRGSFIFCPHGPLLNWENPAVFKKLVEKLREIGKAEKVNFIRVSPLIARNEKNRNIFKELGFRDAPIHMMHPELSWMLDISIPKEKLLENMEKRTRYSIKKSQKEGVEIKISSHLEDVEIFYAVYAETAKRQGFVPFSKDYIREEFKIFSAENKILFFLAYYKKELVAAAVAIFSNGSGFYHHGGSLRKYSNIPASEMLQWEAIQEAQKRNLQLYNFWGISPEADKNHPWKGISKFKKGFGGFAEEYLHCQDIPLNYKYWFNYAIEKARKIKRGY